MFKYLTYFSLFATLAFCQSAKTFPQKLHPIEYRWILLEMNGKNSSELFKSEIPTIGFSLEQHLFYGKNGCNDYSGNFMMSGTELQFLQPIKVTRMYCDTGGMENNFMSTINLVDSYHIENNGMTLILLSKNKIVFKFSKQL